MTSWQFRAVLFDLDGVWVDSTACIERHWRQWASQHQLNIEDILRFAHGRRTVETIRRGAPHLQADEEASRFAAGEAHDTEGVIAIEGAAQRLQDLPHKAWAMVTSGPKATAIARLTQAGLFVPALLVTADDVPKGKPDPEAYLYAAKRLGLAPEQCLVIEDAPAGLLAAKAAGMSVFAVPTTHNTSDLTEAHQILSSLLDIRIRSTHALVNNETLLNIDTK